VRETLARNSTRAIQRASAAYCTSTGRKRARASARRPQRARRAGSIRASIADPAAADARRAVRPVAATPRGVRRRPGLRRGRGIPAARPHGRATLGATRSPELSHTTLVDVPTLAAELADPSLRIVDCRFDLGDPDAGAALYRRGHLPGAVYAHLDADLSGPRAPWTGRHPLPEPEALAATLGALGIGAGIRVVAYDDSGGIYAARLWWLLHWLGHDAVALLDGGFASWQRQGRELSAEIPVIHPTEFHAAPDDSLWVDSNAMLEAVQRKRVIIDARPEERFSGLIEPLDKVAGHIPGSINSPFEDNLDMRGNFLKAEELRAQYESLLHGALPGEVIHMCGSGVTACHNLLALEIAGMSGGKLYVGSWSEWITDPSRPIVERSTT
jgi:thiosulfate/3-mercaptopyruvate sulfurtransferase